MVSFVLVITSFQIAHLVSHLVRRRYKRGLQGPKQKGGVYCGGSCSCYSRLSRILLHEGPQTARRRKSEKANKK